MGLIVQKYGGTSVGTIDRMRHVAARIAQARSEGNSLVVVISAMAGETNRLLTLARSISRTPDERECDVLLSTGEQVSVALLAMAVKEAGQPAVSLLGHQIRLVTDSAHGKARILDIDSERLMTVLESGNIAIVAGFQGVDRSGNITTLGRGGSDTTAVALAAALKAKACEIFTDVEGVFAADPRLCESARKLERISYDEMLELASLGAKVLQIRSVEFAKRYSVPLHVRSTFSDKPGTWVTREDSGMESTMVSGVACDTNEAKITLLRVADRPGLAAKILGSIADANIVIDMIIQNASADGTTDVTFTVPDADFEKALAMVKAMASEVGASGVTTDTNIAKVSVVGLGMRSHAGVAAKMFRLLAAENINIQMISTSEIKVSVVIEAKYAELAVRVLHDGLILANLPRGNTK